MQQFTSGPAPPVVSEVRVTSVTDSTATIEFSVNPSGAATHYVISYDTDDTGATETVPVDVGSGADPVPVKHVLTHLSPGTRVHVRRHRHQRRRLAGLRAPAVHDDSSG